MKIKINLEIDVDDNGEATVKCDCNSEDESYTIPALKNMVEKKSNEDTCKSIEVKPRKYGEGSINYNEGMGRYLVRVSKNSKQIYLGSYTNRKEAVKVLKDYNEKGIIPKISPRRKRSPRNNGMYVASIKLQGRQVHLGEFKTEKEALAEMERAEREYLNTGKLTRRYVKKSKRYTPLPFEVQPEEIPIYKVEKKAEPRGNLSVLNNPEKRREFLSSF